MTNRMFCPTCAHALLHGATPPPAASRCSNPDCLTAFDAAGTPTANVGAHEDVEQITGFYLATAQMMRDRKPVPSRVMKAAEKFMGLLDEQVPEIRFETADDDVIISAITPPPTAVQVLRPTGAYGAVKAGSRH